MKRLQQDVSEYEAERQYFESKLTENIHLENQVVCLACAYGLRENEHNRAQGRSARPRKRTMLSFDGSSMLAGILQLSLRTEVQ